VANKEFSPKNRIRIAVGIGLIPALPVFVFSLVSNLYMLGTSYSILDAILGSLILTVLVALLYGLFASIAWFIANIAERKGRSWPTFFILSLLFPIVVWIIVAAISTDTSTLRSGTKKCPKCAEVVKEEAVLCKHCGSDLKAK
jgi:hypothetical protein